MRRFLIIRSTVLLLVLGSLLDAAVKPQYGGNLKVADELLSSLQSQNLFAIIEGAPRPLFPFPYAIEGAVLTVDLTAVNPDTFTEVEKGLLALQNPEHACHWVLDYPYLSHRHTTSIEARDGKIRIEAESPDTLQDILDSPCLLPEPVASLQPFVKTQFGYEANPNCLSGRPFLDSVTPAPVDPVNPYLSFKLNDADVIPVPEDRYQQVSRDPDIHLAPGPKYFVYLKTTGLSPEMAATVAAAIRISDLSRAVLNGHAEAMLNSIAAAPPKPGTRIHMIYPEEPPYRLIGERIEVELREAGFDISPAGSGAATLQLQVFPVHTANDDIMKYLVLRKMLQEPKAVAPSASTPWYEIWDQYETSGRILPLLLHTSTLAVRQGIQNLRSGPAELPDFSVVWREPQP